MNRSSYDEAADRPVIATEPGVNLSSLLSRHAGGDVAVIDLSSSTPLSLTYRELDETCSAVARGLRVRGLETGDRIAILALNGWAYIALLFGAVRAGCVPIPVNIKLPAAVVRDVLEAAGVRLAFIEAAFADQVPGGIETIDIDDGLSGFLDPGAFEPVEPAPGQVSMQPYTGGTTGRPKGVLLTHTGQLWAARILARHRGIAPDERMLLSAPFFHKNAIVAIKTALVTGACLVVLPRFTAASALDAIMEQRCTTLTGVPTMMHLVLGEMARRGLTAVETIRTISIGSAPASPSLLAALGKAFPNAAIHLNYGTTEGGPISFGWFHPEGKPRPLDSIGYPLPGCELRLEGGEDDSQGELWVRNPGVAAGYDGLPEDTARSFVDGWYRTGDVLRRDADGWWYFVGRVDDMFVCGGENIHPQAVEIMLERHPDIEQAVVLPFAHESKGEVPHAFVVARKGAGIDEAAVKAFALENGPAYAHPRRVVFVDALPLTGANKVDRAALRAMT